MGSHGTIVGAIVLGAAGIFFGPHIGICDAFGAISGLYPATTILALIGGLTGNLVGGKIVHRTDDELETQLSKVLEGQINHSQLR